MKKLHFIGIGGIGMSAIAKILLEKGYKISGSDVRHSELLDELAEDGATVFYNHAADNLKDAEAVVISSAIKNNNPELVAAKERGLKIYHRSDMLALLLNEAEKGIAVAGSHGKTTTSSMLGVVFDVAGVNPTVIIGGSVDYFSSNARLGNSEYVIAEADESDGSFLKFHPYGAVITNIEDDHMDHYGSMENIMQAFKIYAENVADKGILALCFDHENVRNLAQKLQRSYVSYAISHPTDYRAVNLVMEAGHTSFDVEYKGENLGQIVLQVPGKHNVLNALATIAVGRFFGLSMQDLRAGFTYFHGANRRFQTKGKSEKYWIVDDYAHHPTEIKMTLKAAREIKPARLVCVFQPHRYTRTQLLAGEFATCFKDADVLVLTDIYSAGEEPIPGVTGASLAELVRQQGQDVVYIEDKADILPYLKDNLCIGDLVITMGAGDIYKCGEALVQELERGQHTSERRTHYRRVAVIMGGPSSEAEISRLTGSAIVEALRKKGYQVTPIELHPKTLVHDVIKSKCDVVFNAVHGKYGEDGLIQASMEMLGIPYTGSGVLASALTMNKATTKRMLISAGLPTPRALFLPINKKGSPEIIEQIKESFSLPLVIKAVDQGSSIGVYIINEEEQIVPALQDAFSYSREVLVEEFIRGRELTVAVCGNKDKKALPIIEIVTDNGLYDYHNKYTKGCSRHIIPAPLTPLLAAEIENIAIRACEVTECKGVARVDIILSEDDKPYILEINTVPGMTEVSLVPDAARAAQISFADLCENILAMTQE